MKIKKGDKVQVLTGKDKGKKGTVLRVIPSKLRVVVSGVNLVKKHSKPTQASDGGIIQKESSIHISNISHIDPKTSSFTKVGYKILEDGTKVRFAKKSDELILIEG